MIILNVEDRNVYVQQRLMVIFQTAEQFVKDMEETVSGKMDTVSGGQESPLAYDAIWALALALGKG